MGPNPPSDREVEEVISCRVTSRSAYRSTQLSTVETIDLTYDDGSRVPAFIKTTRPILSHEPTIYRLLESCDVNAAKFIGSGRTSSDDPWMVVSAVSDSTEVSIEESSIRQALGNLATVHSRYHASHEELSSVPRWDVEWLASEAPKTCDTLLRHSAPDYHERLSEDHLAVYRERLCELANCSGQLGSTLVHGDFDPGNLAIQSNGAITVLDWGLSHQSTPLIDLAHMVERFDSPARARLAAHYLASLTFDIALGEQEAVRLGGIIHRAFFIWWHTTVIGEGWATMSDYGDVIAERVRHVVAQPCLEVEKDL